MIRYEFLEHTGDIKFRAYGKSVDELFANSALAVSYFFSKGKKIKAVNKKQFSARGKDYESLLYDLIENLIYLLDAENFIVSKLDVKIEGFDAKCIAYGDESSKYKDLDSIKSPTYAEMYVRNNNERWECQVVLDV